LETGTAPIHHRKFCIGAVPYTVQEHDCGGIIAVTAAGVHAIG
jgi:hypothetical protein